MPLFFFQLLFSSNVFAFFLSSTFLFNVFLKNFSFTVTYLKFASVFGSAIVINCDCWCCYCCCFDVFFFQRRKGSYANFFVDFLFFWEVLLVFFSFAALIFFRRVYLYQGAIVAEVRLLV